MTSQTRVPRLSRPPLRTSCEVRGKIKKRTIKSEEGIKKETHLSILPHNLLIIIIERGLSITHNWDVPKVLYLFIVHLKQIHYRHGSFFLSNTTLDVFEVFCVVVN